VASAATTGTAALSVSPQGFVWAADAAAGIDNPSSTVYSPYKNYKSGTDFTYSFTVTSVSDNDVKVSLYWDIPDATNEVLTKITINGNVVVSDLNLSKYSKVGKPTQMVYYFKPGSGSSCSFDVRIQSTAGPVPTMLNAIQVDKVPRFRLSKVSGSDALQLITGDYDWTFAPFIYVEIRPLRLEIFLPLWNPVYPPFTVGPITTVADLLARIKYLDDPYQYAERCDTLKASGNSVDFTISSNLVTQIYRNVQFTTTCDIYIPGDIDWASGFTFKWTYTMVQYGAQGDLQISTSLTNQSITNADRIILNMDCTKS